jgi:hypothetical protein
MGIAAPSAEKDKLNDPLIILNYHDTFAILFLSTGCSRFDMTVRIF